MDLLRLNNTFHSMKSWSLIRLYMLVLFYLDGDADLWFQLLEHELIYVTWEDYKNEIQSRFGPNQFEDHFDQLI